MQTHEETQVHVHGLDLFVMVQLLDDTPAVLSFGKLFEEHGYSHVWTSGQKPHLTPTGKTILCKTENFVLVVFPGLSSSSSASSSSTSFPKTHRVFLRVQQVYEVTILMIKRQETDAIIPKQKNEDNKQAGRNRLRDIPEWLEEFTDNLEDAEVLPALANTSHDSDAGHRTKVASRKHSFLYSLP